MFTNVIKHGFMLFNLKHSLMSQRKQQVTYNIVCSLYIGFGMSIAKHVVECIHL